MFTNQLLNRVTRFTIRRYSYHHQEDNSLDQLLYAGFQLQHHQSIVHDRIQEAAHDYRCKTGLGAAVYRHAAQHQRNQNISLNQIPPGSRDRSYLQQIDKSCQTGQAAGGRKYQ